MPRCRNVICVDIALKTHTKMVTRRADYIGELHDGHADDMDALRKAHEEARAALDKAVASRAIASEGEGEGEGGKSGGCGGKDCCQGRTVDDDDIVKRDHVRMNMFVGVACS